MAVEIDYGNGVDTPEYLQVTDAERQCRSVLVVTRSGPRSEVYCTLTDV